MKNVFLVVGTRPEAIKMAPVYRAMKRIPGLDVTLVSTGQHRELLAQAMESFGMKADIDLRTMTAGQTLSGLTCSLLRGFEGVFSRKRPDLLLAHGDTTTCFSAALSCFYHRVPMAHVEAGLRTYHLDSPFPEEFNRQGVAKLADFHFAPDALARENLLREGVAPSDVCVTGTTAVDAVREIGLLPSSSFGAETPVSVITLHRRENGAEKLRAMLSGLGEAARLHPAMTFIYPVHPNPSVKNAAREILGSIPNVHLAEPMAYRDFIGLLARSRLVITDSGGIQEEAAYLGKRVLLFRDHTERTNGMDDGRVSLVGTQPGAILKAVTETLGGGLEIPVSGSSEPGESPSLKIAQEVQRRLAC